MAVAASLVEAANLAWSNLEAKSIAGTLRTNMLAFAAAAPASFSPNTPGDRPIVNWLAVIRSFAGVMSGVAVIWTGDGLRRAADLIYRICSIGAQLLGQNTITAGQGAALLAAYNAAFA